MPRWLAGFLILPVLVSSLCVAQDAPSKKSDEPRKSNSAAPTKKLDDASFGNDEPLPAGSKVWISPEKFKELEDRYQKLRDQLNAFERQLKKEKGLPSACKLTGRLDGDVAAIRAEFLFATAAPQSVVFLGLKNGFLTDEGQIDDGVPHLESTDDGYLVRVDKEGSHRVTLNLRAPVVAKRATGGSVGNERGFDLGLPGSAVTTLALELPAAIKDVRWNDIAATSKRPGHWDSTLGAIKNLSVIWKEPATAPSAVLGPSARAALKVKIEDGRVEIAGDIVLEDAKNPTREWQLLLPPQAKISPAAGSAPFTWLPPDGKSNTYLIRLTEPTDKVTVSMQAQFARTLPQQKLPIGPVLVQGTPIQGTIVVQSATGALRGQRLMYHRFGEIFQRDPPKAVAGTDQLAQFQFWNATFSGKSLSPNKAPLELEWKTEKGQVDASAEHDIKLRDDHGQWLVDIESRFLVQAANSGVDTLDLQTPTPTLPELLWLGVQPSAGFPAALRWPVALTPRPALSLHMSVADDGGVLELAPADGQHRVRLKLNRPIGKEMVVTAQSRLLVPADSTRFLLELPKLVGVQDRGAKVTIWAPPGQEFLVGAPWQTEPVHDKLQQTFEQMPTSLDLTWRGSHRERLARAQVDMTVRDHSVQIRQTLHLPAAAWTAGPMQTGQLALRLPSPGFAFAALNVPRLSQDKTTAWVKLPAESKDEFTIELEYDIPLPAKRDDAAFAVPLLWPEGTTSREAKIRLWTEPGVTPVVVGLGDIWKERPLEKGDSGWPALVAAGVGPNLPFALRLEQADGHRLPVMVADRSLIQVHVDEDGVQSYRCRFLVKRFAGNSLEIELPAPWDQATPVFRVAGKDIGGIKVVDALRHRVRVPLAPQLYPQPVLFDVEYRIPPSFVEGKRFWQTPLTPPHVVGDVVFGPTRWQVSLPGNQIPLVLGATSADYRWAVNGWLLAPEASVTSTDLDAWIGADHVGDDEPISLAWWRGTVEPQRVYQFPRQFWIVLCSAVVLFLGMLLLLTPVPRFGLGLVVLAGALGLVALGLFHEYLLPVILMGSQPGLAVLILVGGIHLVLHERHRRQLTSTPTFSRVPQGSTLVRGQAKPVHDPSTIDAPASGMPGSVKHASH